MSEITEIDNTLQVSKETRLYLKACSEYKQPVDPSVVVTLQTEWNILHINQGCKEGCLLPLIDVLKNNTTVDTLILKPPSTMHNGSGDSNARALAEILKTNRTIKEVDLSGNGISAQGISVLSKSLVLSSVEKLFLSYNYIGSDGGQEIVNALKSTKSPFKTIDLSHNGLGWPVTREINLVLKDKAMVKDKGNFVFEEILNSVTHGFGFLASILGICVLMYHAQQTRYHFWGCLLYSLSLLTLYLASTLYHSFFLMPSAHHIFQIIDHAAIYILIAGSYTPFCLVNLAGTSSGVPILVCEWILALIGVNLSIFIINNKLHGLFWTVSELGLYVAMGWMIVICWGDVSVHMADSIPLVAAGGLSYTLGVVFFCLDFCHPIFHPIFHVFVMIGSTCHYFAILLYVAWGATPFMLVRSLLNLDCGFVHMEAEALADFVQKAMGCTNTTIFN